MQPAGGHSYLAYLFCLQPAAANLKWILTVCISQLIHHGKNQHFPCSLKTFKVNADSLKREYNKKKCVISVTFLSSSLKIFRYSGSSERSWVGQEEMGDRVGKNTTVPAHCTPVWMSDLSLYCIFGNQSRLKCVWHAWFGFLGSFTCDKTEDNQPWQRDSLCSCGELEGSPWLSLQPLPPESSSLRWQLLVSDFHQLLVMKKFENQEQF